MFAVLEEEKISTEKKLVEYFSTPSDHMPAENELEAYLKNPFMHKIPIRHKLYHEISTSPELTLLNIENYFVDEDAVRETGDAFSTLCEAALTITIRGSENNLISEYDALVKRIWQKLSESIVFELEVNRNVADPSGATQKLLRPDLIALILDVLIFKAEEKRSQNEFNDCVEELESKMEE